MPQCTGPVAALRHRPLAGVGCFHFAFLEAERAAERDDVADGGGGDAEPLRVIVAVPVLDRVSVGVPVRDRVPVRDAVDDRVPVRDGVPLPVADLVTAAVRDGDGVGDATYVSAQ